MIGNNFRKQRTRLRPAGLRRGKLENRNQSGFTLMEMLVVLAIFSILAVVIINVFVLALQSQKQTSFRQKTVANLRYVLETMAKQIRMSEIDYSAGAIISPVSSLALIDSAGQKVTYSLTDEKQIKVIIEKGGTTEEAFLTDPRDVEVVFLRFYISPQTNPFSEERCNEALTPTGCLVSGVCTVNDFGNNSSNGFCECNDTPANCKTKNCVSDSELGAYTYCLPFNYQPRVTVDLGFMSKGVKVEEIKTIYIQTTVSSRIYRR